jgi:hypothetical protein
VIRLAEGSLERESGIENRRKPSLAVTEQRPRLDSEPFCDACNVVDRDIAFSPLDGPEVSPVNPAFMGKRLLADTAFGAEPTHVLRQDIAQGAFVRPAQILRIDGFRATAFKLHSPIANIRR